MIVSFKQIKLTLFFVLLSNLSFTQPPIFVQPVAHYPMEVEGEKIFRFYDVSGKGNHGTVINESNKPLDSVFRKAFFPNNVACIQKYSKYNAVVSIPNVFKNSHLKEDGFSLSFWLYININNEEGNGAFQSGNVVSTSAFSIQLLRDELNAVHFSLYYPVAFSPGFEFIRDNTGYTQSGWYFVCISFGGTNNRNIVDFVTYYYSGTYNPESNALHGTTYENLNSLSIPDNTKDNSGTLLDQNFQGKIWDIRFFDTYLYDIAINNIRNDGWYSSRTDGAYALSNRYYAVENALSFYPCTINSGYQLKDVYSERNSIDVSGISFVKDRFQNASSAIQLTGNGFALLPNFYMQFKASPGFDVRIGYTISFWTYIDQFIYPPDNESIPFTDQDILYQFYFISHPAGMLGGMGLKRDKAIINRFTNLNPLRYWNMWLWEPVSFKNQKGWYHVILSQRANGLLAIIYKPDGTQGCRLNYFNSQDFAKQDLVKFGFGLSPQLKSPGSQSCKYLDDIRIFNWPFSQKDASILHAYEKINP